MLKFFSKSKKIELKAPFKGKIVSITEVPDPVFSDKMLGDGFAVMPEGDVVDVLSPVSGVIVNIFPTLHAFGIKTEEGVEVLVHIGLETVALKGLGFTKLKNEGDRVAAGEAVITVDFSVLKNENKEIITPVVITNSDIIKSIKVNEKGCEVEL